jgi:hypothetical protein
MFDWLIRDYENIVRRLFKQRGGIIEKACFFNWA